jgi:hypothetical protein
LNAEPDFSSDLYHAHAFVSLNHFTIFF